MLKLIIAGLAGLFIISVIYVLIRNKPDLWFWIFLNLFFDPGGYITEYFEGNIVGPLNISDFIIAGIVICLISEKINWKLIFQDQFFLRFLLLFILFAAYYYIVYGGIVPYFHDDFDYPTFLIKNRVFAYGFIILIAVYAFSLKGLTYFYTTTLSIGAICLSLYLITLITGINLIPVIEETRSGHREMMRISMGSYGLFDMIFPLTLIAYLLSKKINFILDYKVWLYYSAIVMLVTLLITLTRRTQLDIIWTILIIVMIISYLFRTGKISELSKLILPAVVVILALYFTFPKYVDYVSTIGQDVILLLTTGKDTKGNKDYRVSGADDLDVTKEYIRNNLFFGTGYTYLYWGPGYAYSPRGPKYSLAADAANEVPIYNLLFGFGIVGAIFMLPLYFMLLRLFFKLIKLLKLTLKNYLLDPITLIFSIYVLFMIAGKFTYRLYTISMDFTGLFFGQAAILIGLGFALYRKINLNMFREL
jgi:hypothetical protein